MASENFNHFNSFNYDKLVYFFYTHTKEGKQILSELEYTYFPNTHYNFVNLICLDILHLEVPVYYCRGTRHSSCHRANSILHRDMNYLSKCLIKYSAYRQILQTQIVTMGRIKVHSLWHILMFCSMTPVSEN